jgi:hypothetical protein
MRCIYLKRHKAESYRRMVSKLEMSRNQPWPNWRHCPRISQEGLKCKGRTHLGHLSSRAAFEDGTFRIGRRIITDSKRSFDFLELVEEEW